MSILSKSKLFILKTLLKQGLQIALLIFLGWFLRGYHEEDKRNQELKKALAKAQEAMIEYQNKKEELERESQELLDNLKGDDAPLSPLFRDYLDRLSKHNP